MNELLKFWDLAFLGHTFGCHWAFICREYSEKPRFIVYVMAEQKAFLMTSSFHKNRDVPKNKWAQKFLWWSANLVKVKKAPHKFRLSVGVHTFGKFREFLVTPSDLATWLTFIKFWITKYSRLQSKLLALLWRNRKGKKLGNTCPTAPTRTTRLLVGDRIDKNQRT